MAVGVADSFQGGVGVRDGEREDLRARVAVQGAGVHALTGSETFRIPLARCSLERAGSKIVVRDTQSALSIWSEEEGFLDALGRAQHGMLRDQAHRLQPRRSRGLLLKACGVALMLVVALRVAGAPLARWAVRGGVPSIANQIGESSLQRLAFPSGVAPMVEGELVVLAERLRPAAPPPVRSFRLLLADYAYAHSFSLPPCTVVVSAGLVCDAEGPDPVMLAVARELAHLESNDVSQRVAESVDWDTALDLLRGDRSKLSSRMLDFASPKSSPGFTPEQDSAANLRASALLARVDMALGAGVVLETARAAGLPPEATTKGHLGPTGTPPLAGERGDGIPEVKGASDWRKVRAEACELIGR